MSSTLKTKKKNIPDHVFCTYWWIIHLKQECRTNPNVHNITGYSKFQGQAEALNNIDCLISKILMLNKNLWIEKSTHIEIFKKPAPATLPNKATDRQIITLYANDYEIPIHLIGKIPYGLKKFLDEFYECRRGNATTDKLIPLPDKTKSKDDLFILSKYNFKSIRELLTWCENQIANGESKIMVENFYRKYLPKLS